MIILGYFLHQGRENLLTDPFRAIKGDAAIIIETKDLQGFINSVTTGKGLSGEIEKISGFSEFNRRLRYLADRINDQEFKRFLNVGKSVISFHPGGEGKLYPFLSLSVPSDIRMRQLREAIRSTGIRNAGELRVNGKTIIITPFNNGADSDTLFLALNSGLLVCSTSGDLVRTAIERTAGDADIRSAPGFSRLLVAAGKDEDKLFIVFSNLAEAVRPLLKPEAAGIAGRIAELAGSAVGDIYINGKGITLSGYTETDSTGTLSRHKGSQPAVFHTSNILPSSTVLFETLIVKPGLNLSVSGTGMSGGVHGFAEAIAPYLGEEVTRAFIDIKGSSVKDNTVVIYELSNRVQCEQICSEGTGRNPGINYFRPDDQTTIPVYPAKGTGLASVFMPGFAPGFRDSYIAFYDNFMITGNSVATISRVLYDNLLNKTLANDQAYSDFESQLPSRAGYLFYCVPARIIDFLAGYLKEGIIEGLKSNRLSLSRIPSVGYQFASVNGIIYNSLSVRYEEDVREESTTEWETLLDTIASIKPFLFTNHNTGAKEIFIQDMNNNAYLINSAGRVLWKVPLGERINGSVYMIDYYRNGKYQLLFSGRNQLHLLDRNGNYVDRYPVKLRSPATNPLSLFDYDNNRNYRLVIAGEDKMIYAYEKNGSIVKGWNPFRTAGYVTSEAAFFRVSGKDYLVVADETAMYFLDRSGNIRLSLKEPVTRAGKSGLRLTPGSEPSLVCSAPDGTVQHIFFDGSVKKYTFRSFSVDHSFDFFDVDSDGFGEYIFIDKGILYLYDNNRKELFKREFSSEDLGGPINFIFSASDRKIGVFEIDRKLIYLIGEDGMIMKGFPLRGASMFSVGKLSEKDEFHLIVGGTDRFLYNYKLDTSTN